jgi:hypothetical protein
MKNVKVTRNGSKLVIECDLSVDLGPSGSGKSIMVATSEGIKPVEGEGGFQIGLNLFRKNADYKAAPKK